ncbi:sigma-E processing peptidase SpoIIGA [Oceanobacillus bengalensis]|uniref:Sporulation sigma-E factor-processing peptidase n=1 Tax=Oceanobacillus bengalensis TaxID=1435466 RepID=A0A494Z2R2_9BACI|nr:sigma-E processing peptidase SpoIIGA [Oceanobacillus bengalensis]RKQ16301.1 sigma-E processing peptidase SpoIIGA [Oceanobacillus bengalensis]
MTIYLDAVWALNFCLDLMLLMLTQALARDSTRKIRVVFGALVASLIVPVTLYFPDSFFTSVIGKLLFSLFIILCSFGFITIYRFFKLLLLFYFTTFAIGGGLLGLHFLFSNPVTLSSGVFSTVNHGYGDPVSWLFVIIGFPLVWLFTKARMDKHVIEKIRYNSLYSVTIQIKEKSFSTNGYIDSGNQLNDPLTKKPVVICDELFLKNWFSEEDLQLLQRASESFDLELIPKEWEHLVQIIPFQGVQGSSMFLLAIRPEKIIIYYGDQKIVTGKVLIGIQFAELTKDRSYHCLLHPQIIQLAAIHSA